MTPQKKSPAKASAQGLPSYGKPPVNEVVMGLRFAELQGLKIPHIGLFWERIRDRYPLVEHAAPLTTTEGILIDSATSLPLPRVWLIDQTETRLVQLQANAFYFNWRHRKDDDVYPRYENIAKEFRSTLGVFLAFLDEMKLGTLSPLVCELTYINHIPKGIGWETINDLSYIFTDPVWTSKGNRFLPRPTNLAWNAGFPLPGDKGRLHIKLSEAIRRSDSVPLLVLEIGTRGLGEEKSIDKIWDWYAVAHEWIVRGFADVTTAEIQSQQWERNDVPTR